MRRLNWKGFVVGVLVLTVVAFSTAVVVWMMGAKQPSETALNALQSDHRVRVTAESGTVFFEPMRQNVSIGFVFYPGAGVDYRSYSPVLRQIAAQGFFVVLLPVPLNLAFFDGNAAARVIAKYPEIQHWAVGGHSLGGVTASSYAANHPDIKGIAFWASYPSNDALKSMDTKALSIYGTNDGLTTIEKINESRALLPADTQFVAIEGGNHAQFGSYGFQTGDNKAAISPEEQWTQTAEATVKFLDELLR